MIRVIAIGKMKDKALRMLEDEYVRRLTPFHKTEIIEVRDEPASRGDREKDNELARIREGERALDKIREDDFVILLDLHGKEWDSETFAKNLGRWQERARCLTFVIAGSTGPSKALVSRADERWKLSSLTFTHLMTRVLLLEQVYRASMILNNRTYHK